MLTGWKGTSHDPAVASFRYRVKGPVEALAALGHPVEVFDPARAHAYDQVVFCKAYTPADRELARQVRARGGRVVFDLCDNHLYNPFDHPKYRKAPEHIGEMVALADQVVCSTPALADVLRAAYGRTDIVVVQDAVEAHTSGKPGPRRPGPLRLLWFGSHGSPNAPAGMSDLLLIAEQLEALARRARIELVVCSNNRAKYDERIAPLSLPTRYVDWSLDGFGPVLADADAVVLPATLNPFTVCKTHNRLTTALHAGLPTVATGLPSYREFEAFCFLDDWTGGLRRAVEDNASERRRARAARQVLDRDWTLAAIVPQWERALGLSRSVDLGSGAAAPRLLGRLDAVVEQALSGWVFAPGEPERRFEVALEVEGRTVAKAAADQARLDLEKVGLPSGCGFVLPAPPPGRPWRVRVGEIGWTFRERPLIKGEPIESIDAGHGLLTPPAAGAKVRADLNAAVRARRSRLRELTRDDASDAGSRGRAVLEAIEALDDDETRARAVRRPALAVVGRS